MEDRRSYHSTATTTTASTTHQRQTSSRSAGGNIEPASPSDHSSREAGNSDTDDANTTSSSVKERLLPLSSTMPRAPPPPKDLLVGPIVFLLLTLISLVFTVVSIGIPWYRSQQYMPGGGASVEKSFYLFKHVTKVSGQPAVVTRPWSYCTPVRRRVKVIESFAIISSALLFLAFVFGMVYVCFHQIQPLYYTTVVLTACAFCSLTIECAVNFNVYTWSFSACGVGSSYHSQLYEPYAGFGLTVTAWVLMAVAGVTFVNNVTLPWDARTVSRCRHAYAFFSLVAFLLSVVSCPIPHFFYKSPDTNQTTDVLLWRERVSRFGWKNYSSSLSNHGEVLSSLWVKQLGCPALERYFRAAEAFNIVTIAITMASGLCAIMLWKKLAGTQIPALLFTYLGVVVSIVQVALELTIYYRSWCGGTYAYHRKFYVLTAGFALATTVFCLMCVAACMLTISVVLTERYYVAKRPFRTARAIIIAECE